MGQWNITFKPLICEMHVDINDFISHWEIFLKWEALGSFFVIRLHNLIKHLLSGRSKALCRQLVCLRIRYCPLTSLISIVCLFAVDLSCVTEERAARVNISRARLLTSGHAPSVLLHTCTSCVSGSSLILWELDSRDSAAVTQILCVTIIQRRTLSCRRLFRSIFERRVCSELLLIQVNHRNGSNTLQLACCCILNAEMFHFYDIRSYNLHSFVGDPVASQMLYSHTLTKPQVLFVISCELGLSDLHCVYERRCLAVS